MFWIIVSFILLLISFVALGIDFSAGAFKLRKRQLLSLFSLVIILGGCYKFVPVNTVGIKFNQFSGVSEDILTEGLKFKSPLDVIYLIPTEVRTLRISEIYGQTRDAQNLKIVADFKYKVSGTNAFKVFKEYRTLENVDTNLIASLVQSSIENITTEYNIIDIMGAERNAVLKEIEAKIIEKLKGSGIEFLSIVLLDTDAGEAIETAIEAETVAKKAVETAQQTQEKAKIEAETKVLEAESAAKVKMIEAQAQADSNKLISSSLTPQILEMRMLDARFKHGWVEVITQDVLVSR